MNIAVYPASFDPVTNGHLDIIERAARVFDKLIVCVFKNPRKAPLFTVEERVEMLNELTAQWPSVEVDASSSMVTAYARRRGARVIIKGLRAVSDFEYEFQMALINKKLDQDIETMFMMAQSQYQYLSSSIVKELASYGADLSGLVPPSVEHRLRQKFAFGGEKEGQP